MKINKKNPKHWLILIKFTIITMVVVVFRIFSVKNTEQNIILYGHKLNGNLKALYQYGKAQNLNITFLTIDPEYNKILTHNGIDTISGIQLKNIKRIAKTSLIISDHGLHSLVLLMYFTDIKFVDVWHGIPFKGFDQNDFKVQHNYDEVWVTSELLKKLYIEKFGFSQNNVKSVGYARTDKLINQSEVLKDIKIYLGIPNELHQKKIILFAPTWNQDNLNRNIYPFGLSEENFLQQLHVICKETNSICLIRKHLNTTLKSAIYPEYIFECSSAEFPDTEDILLVSDILICDWSSIAFDFLLLDRPTLFLEVESPFKKGFSLDSSYRFGPIIRNLESLETTLKKYNLNSKYYTDEFGTKTSEIKALLYDDLADGNVSARSIRRISSILSS